MAVIQKRKDNKCWQGCVEIGTLVQCWWEFKLCTHCANLKIELSYDLSILIQVDIQKN